MLCSSMMYKFVIENGESKLEDKPAISFVKDSELYYELSKHADEEDAIKLINTAERINPYDYKLAQAGFALSYKDRNIEHMYDYALKWVRLQPMNSEAYEAAAFALYKLNENGTDKLKLSEERTKLIDNAKTANKRINKLSDYIEKDTYIDMENLQKILTEGI